MSRTLPAWTIAGLSLTIAVGCIHALTEILLEKREGNRIGQRTDVNRCA